MEVDRKGGRVVRQTERKDEIDVAVKQTRAHRHGDTIDIITMGAVDMKGQGQVSEDGAVETGTTDADDAVTAVKTIGKGVGVMAKRRVEVKMGLVIMMP